MSRVLLTKPREPLGNDEQLEAKEIAVVAEEMGATLVRHERTFDLGRSGVLALQAVTLGALGGGVLVSAHGLRARRACAVHTRVFRRHLVDIVGFSDLLTDQLGGGHCASHSILPLGLRKIDELTPSSVSENPDVSTEWVTCPR